MTQLAIFARPALGRPFDAAHEPPREAEQLGRGAAGQQFAAQPQMPGFGKADATAAGVDGV